MPSERCRAALAASGLFILLAILFIPYAGIQADEALFSVSLFPHISKDLQLPILPPHVPLMLMTYIGSLKTLLYWPVFRIFGTNEWTLRIPVMLLGAITIFVFYNLADAAAGYRAAAIGAFLLATDPVFLLTNTFDWGPVALEHVFLVTGCWFVYRFGHKCGSDARVWHLAAGFLCWGLALWNKAIFVWALSGLSAGGVMVFLPEIKRCWSLRVVRVALLSFLCGSLPLVIYNLTHKSVTVSENVHVDPRSIAGKWVQVENAANGSSLFGYLVGEDEWPNPKAPHSLHGRAATWIYNRLGEHRLNGFFYVFGVLLLAAPWWWKHRAARFSLVFMTVAWLLMALTHDAGTSAHHVILLWPFPLLFAAIALASLPWRPLAWIAAAIMIAMNLLVLNQYVYQFERNGPGNFFTDAMNPLSMSLDPYSERHLYIIDWGIYENLNLLHEGRLDFRILQDPLLTDSPSTKEMDQIRDMLLDPRALILDHVREREVFPNVGARLDQAARALGFRRAVVQTIPDSNGRPRFEILRFTGKDGA
jgi:hypothetical protein